MLGKIVNENQSDWNNRVQFVITADMASVHDTTSFIPNFFTFGREVCTPIDINVGPPKEKLELWQSHEEFSSPMSRNGHAVHMRPSVRISDAAPCVERIATCESENKTHMLVPRCITTIHVGERINH